MGYEHLERQCGAKMRKKTKDCALGFLAISNVFLICVVATGIFMYFSRKIETDEIKSEFKELKKELDDLQLKFVESTSRSSLGQDELKSNHTAKVATGILSRLRRGTTIEDRVSVAEEGLAVTTDILQIYIRDNCAVRYNEKCFEVFFKPNLKINEGRLICQGLGGHMANIYNSMHYFELLNYIRKKMHQDSIEIILGMSYNVATTEVLLNDGTTAPYFKWLERFPIPFSTQLVIRVEKDKNHEGMWNGRSSGYPHDGVLCEF